MESWQTRLERWGFNCFPAYRGTGARITYIAHDWRQVRIALPLNWRTRNYVGTIFGGSIYAAIDPIYMLMVMKNLGPDYIVWDKAATIHFRKPGKETLYADFQISGSELEDIRGLLQQQRSLDRTYRVTLCNAAGEIHAEIDKVIYMRPRAAQEPLQR